jgi:hypothetical protein
MTTEFNTGAPFAAEEPGTIGAGADIYRKLERKPRRSKMMYATPVIAAVIILGGGAAAYMMMKPSAAPQSAATPAPMLQTAPLPVTPAQPAPAATVQAPTPATQSLVVETAPVAHHATHAARIAAQRVHPRRGPNARSAVTSGEDASAYTPAARGDAATMPPAPVTPVPQPSVASPAPAAIALPPPPAPPPS